jgi:hypothetical protein
LLVAGCLLAALRHVLLPIVDEGAMRRRRRSCMPDLILLLRAARMIS